VLADENELNKGLKQEKKASSELKWINQNINCHK